MPRPTSSFRAGATKSAALKHGMIALTLTKLTRLKRAQAQYGWPSISSHWMKMKTLMKFPVLLVIVTGSFLGLYVLPDVSQYQSHCPCEECTLENDPWFKARFNKSVPVFLTADYQLPEDAYRWWKRILFSKGNHSVYDGLVEEIFKVIPHHPNVMAAGSKKCAVVGNSVNLKGSLYGQLINSHDVVMRMNAAVIKGFEADVGDKTTHHIMYPESSMHLDTKTRLVLFPFKILDLEWLPKALTTGASRFRAKIRANKDLVMLVNPAFMRYVHVNWLEKKGNYPSTGFMTVVLALHICEEVHVFGFGADKEGNWNHYWALNRFKKLKTGAHPGHLEYETIKKLAQLNIIRFYTGV
ncbi:CMP-N-acetylneuraminate-beta-galactosamide-alpha-2,3-sialyltransferase 1-like [Cheilinus undulatus]|uniref:CMP-N-acetylneuraminate-beta-galactosamide- alpha-2,3-sialyltransferase 1-like n=1 Tax=Cheilinus undulatus TaxID=241271 RepID=UPI001BD5757E|nr:CMP-N-acetylneuraminate-beta-galactosamide-alpha-2,3-sialyltransferase 1-like [Cheilinus undulatus]